MAQLKRSAGTYVKWLVYALLAVAIVVGGIEGYRYLTRDQQPLQAAVQRTAMVTRGNLTVSISGTGSIEPVNTKTVTAGSQGTIEQVLVEEGSIVAAGDVIAIFETTDNSRQIRSKELEIQRSKLDLEQLYEQYKMADEDSRRSIQVNIEKQRLSIQAAEEELADLRGDQKDPQILAPISGKITALNVKEGDTVNTNAVVAEIADYSQLQISVPIDELDIIDVEIGQKANILVDAFPDDTFTGTVTEIADQGTYSNGVATFDVTVKIDDPGAIKAGMSAEASIEVASRENVLLLPVDAVRSAGGRYFVIKADSTNAAMPQGGPGQGRRQGNQQPGSAGPQGGTAPQGNAGPQDGAAPQGSARPQGGTAPQGGAGPQGGTAPQGGAGPQGGTAPQGGAGPQGGTGSQGNAAQRSNGGPQGSAGPQGDGRVFIEVGLSNEDFIEIVSGLSEGDVVVLPTVVTSTSNTMTGFPGGGFGGGFPGGGMPGGGFSGGGFPGGGGPGGGMPGGARTGGTGGGR